MAEGIVYPLITGGMGVLVFLGLYKVLRSFYKLIFYFLSLYLFSLLLLAKLGFIEVNVEKFQMLFQQITAWFNSLWDWILNYLSQKSV